MSLVFKFCFLDGTGLHCDILTYFSGDPWFSGFSCYYIIYVIQDLAMFCFRPLP